MKCLANSVKSRSILLKIIGFGGLLHLPAMTKLNQKLSVWLLSKLHQTSQALVFDETKRLLLVRQGRSQVLRMQS